MFASSHARPRSGGAGDARPRAPEPSATERGALITSGRLSVLEQLEKSLKQDRPWEKVPRTLACSHARTHARTHARSSRLRLARWRGR